MINNKFQNAQPCHESIVQKSWNEMTCLSRVGKKSPGNNKLECFINIKTLLFVAKKQVNSVEIITSFFKLF